MGDVVAVGVLPVDHVQTLRQMIAGGVSKLMGGMYDGAG